MTTMSLTSDHLPRMTRNPNDKVATLLLNKEQLEAVNSRKPWRIVRGPFGSGKSLILKTVAKKLYKESKNLPWNVCIVYVCFDAFSLLEAEVSSHFEELTNNYHIKNTELLSLNLNKFVDDNNLKFENVYPGFGIPEMTIADLIQKFCNTDNSKKFHFLIDEFPGRLLASEYCHKVLECLNQYCKDSTVVIALQSINPTIEVHSNGEMIVISSNNLHETGMEIFSLQKSMRMCSNLFELIKIAEQHVNESILLVDYQLPKISSTKKSNSGEKSHLTDKASHETSLDIKQDSGIMTDLSSQEMEFENTVPMELEPQDSPVQVTADISKIHDPAYLQKLYPTTLNRQPSKSLKFKHEFQRSHSGHNIHSHVQPQLILLPKKFKLKKAFSGKLLARVLHQLCLDANFKTTLVCSDIDEVVLAKYALDELPDTNYEVYTPYLSQRISDKNEKEKICKKLREESCVLITDYRSFRGCETDHCITFVKQTDQYAKHVLVEVLSRAISKIDILIFPISTAQTEDTSGSIAEVLEAWKNHPQKLVLESEVNIDRLDDTTNSSQVINDPLGDAVNNNKFAVTFQPLGETEVVEISVTDKENFKSLERSTKESVSKDHPMKSFR